MYKWFIVSLIFLASCGGPIPCGAEYDYYVKGLCVDSNRYYVNEANLQTSLDIAEEEFNRFYPNNPVDLESLFVDHQVTMEFVEFLGPYIRGITFSERRHPETGDYLPPKIYVLEYACLFRTYVVGHEAYHIVADHHLELKGADLGGHYIPNVFTEWADEVGVPRTSTAEHFLYERTLPLCE